LLVFGAIDPLASPLPDDSPPPPHPDQASVKEIKIDVRKCFLLFIGSRDLDGKEDEGKRQRQASLQI
jgi:hypothetical protein